MLLISKGHTRLAVNINDVISVLPMEVPSELRFTSKAVAKSLASLLRYKIKYSPDKDKEQVAVAYLKDLGWNVQ